MHASCTRIRKSISRFAQSHKNARPQLRGSSAHLLCSARRSGEAKKKRRQNENNFVQLHFAITFVRSLKCYKNYVIISIIRLCSAISNAISFFFLVEIIYVLLAVRLMIAGNLVLLHFSPARSRAIAECLTFYFSSALFIICAQCTFSVFLSTKINGIYIDGFIISQVVGLAITLRFSISDASGHDEIVGEG